MSDRDTIHGSVFDAASAHPDSVALRYRHDGRYESVTYRQLASAVELAAGRLRAFGLRKGDAVGILSPNRPQWIVADLAALSLGGVVVPVYHTLPADQLRYIIKDSGMRMLFVGHASLFPTVDAFRSEIPGLEELIFLDDWGIRFADVSTRAGDPTSATPGERGAEGPAGETVGASDPATVVYTSGTTGEPKGVILTHGNIVSNARALVDRFGIGPDDSTVSYLPLAHMFERTCGHYVFLFAGATVAYAEALTTVVRDMAEIRPTVLIAVPRVLEKAYETALQKIESGPWLGRGIVHRAFALLNERANRKYRGERVSLWLDARGRMYDALVASRFRAVGGGRLRLIVSGGAPLDRRVGKILRVLGFGVVEGYGLTETSPVVSCGHIRDHRLGTVGKPLRGVEVRTTPDGEILVRGPNIMKGYLNKPRDTAAVLDRDGWFHTGDLGEFDERGNLVVTGRSKDIIVTSYGKNVAPTPIEERLMRSPYIDQAVVFGDNRKSIVALIVPNRERIERCARERGVSCDSYETLLEHYAIRDVLGNEVKRANVDAASYERVTSFALLAEPFSAENGTLTPTLKLRRKRIAETCTDIIQALYDRQEGSRAH